MIDSRLQIHFLTQQSTILFVLLLYDDNHKYIDFKITSKYHPLITR